jgi:FAD/FMN-containing dehydrogenase
VANRLETLSGWGRFPVARCPVAEPSDRAAAARAVAESGPFAPRGLGRSYGDAALNPRGVLSTLRLDRMIDFDPESGALTCEAGVSLADIVATFLPRGWFPAVTPGTKFVTVGGMIAADVHGKNHHRDGSFSSCLEWVDLALADGRVARCSRRENPALFAATCGGMGLTGLVLAARFRLRPVETDRIRQETLLAPDVDAAMELFDASRDWTYSVAWIDCLATGGALGRSILYRGEHARRDELSVPRDLFPLRRRTLRVPCDAPSAALNRWSVRAFNEVYWRRARPGAEIVGVEPFFYPLDAVLGWNRVYGSGGFLQWQCALPRAAGREGLRALLGRIAASGRASFLAVLKGFGAGGGGPLSFPVEGWTLALDFKADPAVLGLLSELDAVVADHGGRLYLAKDARMSAALLRSGYPALAEFQAQRRARGAAKFSSLLSQRLGL